MKKLLLILLCLPMIGFGQFTFLSDDFIINPIQKHNNQVALDNLVEQTVNSSFNSTSTLISIRSQCPSPGAPRFATLDLWERPRSFTIASEANSREALAPGDRHGCSRWVGRETGVGSGGRPHAMSTVRAAKALEPVRLP